MKLHKLMLCIACILAICSLHAQQQSPNVSIHFAFDKSDINATDLASLKNFKETHPNIQSVIIDGYADPVGTDDYNYALSMRRCNAVKRALGYDENKTEVIFKVTAHGEKGLLFNSDPENRVAIVSVNQKKAEAVQEEVNPQITLAVVQPAAPVQKQIDTVAQATPTPVIKADTAEAVAASAPKEYGDDEQGLTDRLRNSKVGESVVLSDIRFEQASHVFLKSSQASLNDMLAALKALPTLQLEIQGHMCCGDVLAADGFDVDSKEFKLSYNRAKAVFDFMIDHGIDASRLTYKGFGSHKRLVYPEVTDDDRSRNRRVEFLITKK